MRWLRYGAALVLLAVSSVLALASVSGLILVPAYVVFVALDPSTATVFDLVELVVWSGAGLWVMVRLRDVAVWLHP